jgi:hypothetical protein
MKDFPEKGTRRLEWVSCEEAAARVDEPELKSLFTDFAEMSQPALPAVKKAALRA